MRARTRLRARAIQVLESRDEHKTISDGGITIDFWLIKVHTSNGSSNSWGSSPGDHRIAGIDSLNLV